MSLHISPQFTLLFTVLTCIALSQTEDYLLTPENPQPFSHYGDAVSISGDKSAVGAWLESSGRGAAYIYDYTGESWVHMIKLEANDGTNGDNFGASVAISNNFAIAGAPRDDVYGSDSGSAYLFGYDGDNWNQLQKLYPDDGQSYTYFGNAVAIFATTSIIGAWMDDGDGGQSGAAYLYQHSDGTWQKISASDGSNNRNFGNAVAISEVGSVVVGCWHDGPLGNNSGSAYIFEYIGEGWEETAKLVPSDGAAYDEFGSSVAISGTTAVVGAPTDGMGNGTAYIFEYTDTGWTETQILTPSHEGRSFGATVAISGDRIVVGDKDGDGGLITDSGCAYVYEYNGASWQEIEFIYASGEEGYGDGFGTSVSISDTYVLAGAPGYDGEEVGNSGAAYVYHLIESIPGCTDPLACNYDPGANEDDGSCIFPEAELCDDALDNDCDGLTDLEDPDCICTPGETQPCGTSDVGACELGTQTCEEGYNWSACTGSIEPTPETCDGLDNDCDGETDNGFAVGDPCDNGEFGLCYEIGEIVCNGPDETLCNAPEGSGNATDEICNDGLDNDCDGETDLEDADCPIEDYIHVPADYPTIQAAIDASVDGDVILVQPGTYVENINYSGKNITVASAYLLTEDPTDIDLTIIDGNNTGRTVTINGGEDSASLIGFTIINGFAATGGGILIYGSSPLIAHCNLRNNNAGSYGGGLSFNGESDPTFAYLNIYDNNSPHAAGINCYQSTGMMTNILVFGNSATETGGGIRLADCPDVVINKSTLSDNEAAFGGAVFLANSGLSLSNSILWSNLPEAIYFNNNVDPDTLNISFSDVMGGLEAQMVENGSVSWGNGMLDDDPLFTGRNIGEYYLTEASPCIDAGDPDPGQNDPDGTRADMGAFYFEESQITVNANFSGTPTYGNAPLTVYFTDLSTGNPTDWEWDFDNDGIVDSNIQEPEHTYTEPGAYSVSLTVSNGREQNTETRINYISVDFGSVDPLLTTNWPTDTWPFNAYYPEDPDGINGHLGNACGPTAMANILKYWNFPPHGTGDLSFTDNQGFTWAADFRETYYDWPGMPDTLEPGSPEEAYGATATLMYQAAVSMQDIFGTGVSLANLSEDLISYFNYSETADVLARDTFSPAAWDAIFRNELDNGRPILIEGWTVNSDPPENTRTHEGHYFICDGYNSAGEYHIKWNLGDSQGWYRLYEFATYSAWNWIITGLEPGNIPGCTDPIAGNYDPYATVDDGGCLYGDGVVLIMEDLALLVNQPGFADVLMENAEPVLGFQFEVDIDPAIGTILSVSPTDRTTGWMISFNDSLIIGFSMEQSEISIGTGPIVAVELMAEVPDSAQMCISNEIISTYEGVQLPSEVQGCGSLVVLLGIPGDLDQNGAVDVLDIVLMIGIIFGDDASEYELWAADVNDSGTIDVLDIVLLVEIILNGN